MQLIYRGIAYQSIAADLANAQQQTNIKYRKIADIRVLKYRGVDFIKILNY